MKRQEFITIKIIAIMETMMFLIMNRISLICFYRAGYTSENVSLKIIRTFMNSTKMNWVMIIHYL